MSVEHAIKARKSLMKPSFHLGQVFIHDSVIGSPSTKMLLERFVWYVTGPGPAPGVMAYVGVCPEFALIRHGDPLPTYKAVFTERQDADGPVTRLHFERVP
jgi:hypothetical protein